MKALILGGTGMLGHKLYQSFGGLVEPSVTVRCKPDALRRYGFYCPDEIIPGVSADDLASVERAISKVRPHVVVNCIGIVKQDSLAKDPVASISINALFPHRLAALCAAANARLIHISTDCVFSGSKGAYTETDPTDAEDLYGRTKALGEVDATRCLTLRTSIIGRELTSKSGLVEWFLSQAGGRVEGYSRAIFSGLTTIELSRLIRTIVLDHPRLHGLYHVSSEPIDKFRLLGLIRDAFDVSVQIDPTESVRIDRSLDGTRIAAAIDYRAPSWHEMVTELAADPTPYDSWRKQ